MNTTNTAARTPGPYTARGGGHNYHAPIQSEDRSDMFDWSSGIDCYAPFTDDSPDPSADTDTQRIARAYGRTLAEAEANAAFIVEACNNYERVCAERDALAEALKDVLRIATAASHGVTGNAPRLERARAALAKVTP